MEKINGIQDGVNVSLPWKYIFNERLEVVEVNEISPNNFELHVRLREILDVAND